jgi:redox-regulated HSP33 family molecular chaperone
MKQRSTQNIELQSSHDFKVVSGEKSTTLLLINGENIMTIEMDKDTAFTMAVELLQRDMKEDLKDKAVHVAFKILKMPRVSGI